MQKKIIWIILGLLLILSGFLLFLYHLNESKKPLSNVIKAIPFSTSFIIEVKNPHQSWRKLSETNIIWEELLQIKEVSELNRQIAFFDSVYRHHPLPDPLFDNHSLFLSAHKSEENHLNFLFLFNVPRLQGKESIINLSKDVFPGYAHSQREYDDAEIITLRTNTSTFSFSVYKEIFMGSVNAMVVEDAIRQLNTGNSLEDEYGFQRALATSGMQADANMYICHKNFPQFVLSFANKNYSPDIALLRNFADWSALDLKIKPNLFMLNGFTYSSDSLPNFLSLFKYQKARDPGFIHVIPSNTAAFIHFGFSDYSSFYKGFSRIVESSDNDEKIKNLNALCQCDIKTNMLSWVEHEMAVVWMAGNKQAEKEIEVDKNLFAVFRSNHIGKTRELLAALVENTYPLPDSAYHGLTMYKMSVSGAYSLLLGKLFHGITGNFFSIIDDYLIFSNDSSSMVEYLDMISAEKTLARNNNFKSLNELLSGESNIFIYAAMAKAQPFLRKIITEEKFNLLDQYKDLFGKFEALAIQYSNDNSDLYYNNIFIKYNPEHKQENSTLWETRLDTLMSGKPVLVKNHYTLTEEIFVQDMNHTVYLLSNTGKILWKRKISGKIESGTFQVDALKNNKLQMLFNTASEIYLVDRNGKDVSGFPVKLKTPATNGLSVFDYDKNRNYRILIGCADGKIHNYEINGKPVDGWEFPALKEPVRKPIKHFNLEGKDYLIAVDAGGNVYLTERNGKKRMDIKQPFPWSGNNDFYVESGKNIGKTRIVSTDSVGNIVRLSLNGNIENIKIEEFSTNHYFNYQDLDKDKTPEYIFIHKNTMAVYRQDQLRYPVFEYKAEGEISSEVCFYIMKDGNQMIGITDPSSGKLYLIDNTGTLLEGFPLLGSVPFSLGNINNNEELYLITGQGSTVYTYLLK